MPLGSALQFARALVSRLLGTTLQFVAQVAVALTGGAVAAGNLALAQGWIGVLANVFAGGAAPYVLRRLGEARTPEESSTTVSLGLTIVVWASGLGLAGLLPLFILAPERVGLPASPALLGIGILLGAAGYALLKIHVENFKIESNLNLALFLEFSLPFLLVLLSSCALLFAPTYLAAPAISYCAAFMFAGFFLSRRVKLTRSDSLKRALSTGYVELGSNLFVQVGGALLLALPLIVGAATTSAATIGVFSIIIRLVGISSTFSLIINAYAARSVTRSAANSPERLPRLYLLTTSINFVLGGSYLLLLAAWPDRILGLFGPEFSSTTTSHVLRTVALCMLLKQLAGFPDLFLAMRGKSHLDAWSLGCGLAAVGASLAWTGAMSLTDLALAYTAGQIVRLWSAVAMLWLVDGFYRSAR